MENGHLPGHVGCAAQYGPVPIIVCGDFQLNPLHDASVSAAVNNHSWIEPVVQVNQEGSSSDPSLTLMTGYSLALVIAAPP